MPNKVNIHVDEIHEFVRDFMDQFQLGVMKVNHGYYFETVVESNTNFYEKQKACTKVGKGSL